MWEGVHAQLNYGSDMDWDPQNHFSSSCCVRLKMPKSGTS